MTPLKFPTIELYSKGANQHDEIIIIDSVASLYGFKNWLLRNDHKHFYCPIPLSIGGAIGSSIDAINTLHKGADKLIINTSAIEKPQNIEEISSICGRQAVILQVDCKKVSKKYMCFTHGGRELSNYSTIDWIRSAQEYGCGEIHLTSIDTEGTTQMFPEDLAELSFSSTRLPLIISGGIRKASQISKLHSKYGINSFSMSSMTNIVGTKIIKLREQLVAMGHEIRPV